MDSMLEESEKANELPSSPTVPLSQNQQVTPVVRKVRQTSNKPNGSRKGPMPNSSNAIPLNSRPRQDTPFRSRNEVLSPMFNPFDLFFSRLATPLSSTSFTQFNDSIYGRPELVHPMERFSDENFYNRSFDPYLLPSYNDFNHRQPRYSSYGVHSSSFDNRPAPKSYFRSSSYQRITPPGSKSFFGYSRIYSNSARHSKKVSKRSKRNSSVARSKLPEKRRSSKEIEPKLLADIIGSIAESRSSNEPTSTTHGKGSSLVAEIKKPNGDQIESSAKPLEEQVDSFEVEIDEAGTTYDSMETPEHTSEHDDDILILEQSSQEESH